MKKSVVSIAIGIIIVVAGVIVLGWTFLKEMKSNDNLESGVLDRIKNQSLSLGNLCANEEECREFCSNNRGQCEAYCNGKENELCKIIFPPGTEEIQMNNEQCEGAKVKFNYAPVNLDKTKYMLPRGLMTGDHVTPVNHHYFENFDNQEYDIEVYSPGKGYITDIAHMPDAKEGKDYHITIRFTCTVWSYYIYVSNLPEKIKAYAPPIHGYRGVRIPVEAGELIGHYKNNIDFNLIDEEITLYGFVVPEHYSAESYKRHIVPDTYEYFNEPVRSKLIEKSVRVAEPMSGKIDYDIDGKLVGNWFMDGTNWYDDISGHLSFVYDYLDPQRIVISIAGYEGKESMQFGVKGNSPDPVTIGVRDGLVKYELVGYDYIKPDGSSWDKRSFAKNLKTVPANYVQGVALVQMIENRKIKFEAFPEKKGSQVNGFTQNAKVYVR